MYTPKSDQIGFLIVGLKPLIVALLLHAYVHAADSKGHCWREFSGGLNVMTMWEIAGAHDRSIDLPEL